MTDYTDGNYSTSANPEAAENRQTPALIEKFVIRLPKGLRNKIKHLSEQNRRSMNSEIIMVLEKHIQQNLSGQVQDFNAEEAYSMAASAEQPADSELAKRLQNLPEEKKQALLELLG